MATNQINVAMAFDPLAYRGAVMTIQSVVASLSESSSITFHLFTKDIPESAIRFITSLFVHSSKTVKIQTYLTETKEFRDCATLHGSLMVYARLHMANEVSSDRLIYLDSDLIVTKDLTELWETNLEGFIFGAVTLSTVEWANDFPFLSKFGFAPTDAYFNSGVLLIDSAQWRERGTTEKLLQLAKEHGPDLAVVDQTLLNLYFHRAFTHLAPCWNQHVYSYYHSPALSPGIIHFLGMPKPWNPLGGQFHMSSKTYRQIIEQQGLVTPRFLWSEFLASPGQFFRSLRSVYRSARTCFVSRTTETL